MRPSALIALMALVPSAGLAQRTVTLTTPDAELGDAFSVISGVRPLADGRLVVSDSKEKTVQLVSFGGSAKPIGREGRGPGEWLLPNGLAALSGDTTALWDAGNRRFLRIRADGTPAGEFVPQASSFGPFSTLQPRGTDARGNVYFEGSPFTTTGGTPAPADSVAVFRYDRASGAVDTVAFTRPAVGSARVTSFAGGPGFSNGAGNPLTPLDDWVVLPNGQVAVIRGIGYRVDFYSSRVVKTSGPAIKLEPRQVDAAVKTEIIEQHARRMTSGSPRTGANGQVTPPPSAAVAEMRRQFMNLEPWPATLPPFLRRAAIVRATGSSPQIWVLRAKVKDTEPSLYDVLDDAGKLIAHVQLPARTRIAAFGPQVVYTIRADDDDLEYLQRYKLPTGF